MGLRLRWGNILASGDRFVAITQNGEVLLGDVVDSQVKNRFRPLNGNAGFAELLGNDHLLIFTRTGHIERWDLNKVQCTGRLPKPLAIANYWVNTTLRYGSPNQGIFGVYHATPLAVSPDGSLLAVQAGYQFALLLLNWEEPR